MRLYTEQQLRVAELCILELAPSQHLLREFSHQIGDRGVIFNGDGAHRSSCYLDDTGYVTSCSRSHLKSDLSTIYFS